MALLWNSSWRKSLALLAVGLALGLLLSFQWKAEPSSRLADTTYGQDRTVQTIARLEEEQVALKGQVADLRHALDARQQSSAQSAELLQDLSKELQSQRALAGLTAVEGPGVEVALNDSTRPVVPSEVNTEFYLVHDYDLRDVINLLWAVGAEAVAVNDERIVTTTSIYCVGATIMVNDTRMSPPYVIRAIGPADEEESILKNADFLTDLKGRVSRYRLEFKVTRSDRVAVPAYQGGFGVTHASASQ
jgi:uncharacterized protein YlxW (UPF0749 family)